MVCLGSYSTILTIVLVIIKMEDRTCKCDVIKYLGLEIFEIIMLVVLMLTIIYMGFKIQGSGKIWWNKWKESREAAKEVKFQNRRAKYEATTSTTSKRGKVHVETFVHGKRETKREPRQDTKPATYEKGYNYDSVAEEEYQEEA